MNRASQQTYTLEKLVQPMKREILGIIFLVVALILGGSLLSYHPGDRLFWNITGPVSQTKNLFGPVGAHLSGGLFFVMGLASFWLVIVFLAMALLSFASRPIPAPSKNVPAVVILLVSFSGVLSLQLPETISFRGETIMTGGVMGLYLARVTTQFLHHFGASLLLTTIFVISFLVITRVSLERALSGIVSAFLRLVRRFKNLLVKTRERKKRGRKVMIAKERLKSRPKVTIKKPLEQEKMPEQESFSFMKAAGRYSLPSLDLLKDPPEKGDSKVHQESLEMNARILEKKLRDFGVEGEVIEILPGPIITMYEYKPAPGVKISKVAGLSDDLALAFRAPSVRIVAPLPGKGAIGIEIPNNQRQLVFLKEVLSSRAFKDSKLKLPIALGKDITGEPYVADLTRMPHLLVAGATGTGKSVSINAMIHSLLFKVFPEAVRFLMIDPKRIELSIYHDIPHLLHPVVTRPREATKALSWVVAEMERRYKLLSDRGFRSIETYNRRILKKQGPVSGEEVEEEMDRPLPYIILIIDELADLMMVSSKEVEEYITRLAQMARAAGIHLIIATQRPSVDVLTGIIKANFSARISFQVSSKVDSRTILDATGAEHLLGEGDMLFMPPGVGRLTRIHGAFVSEEEIKEVTEFLRRQGKPDYDDTILSEVSAEEEAEGEEVEKDEKYDQAVDIVLGSGQASISMLQRKLRVGYNRAARMIEAMEKEGIVGPSDGVRQREVYGRRPAK